MNEKVIYNCHNHTFTHENVPNNFFPFFLVPLARNKIFRSILRGAMKGIIPFTKNDKVHRYAAFIKASYRKYQEDNFKHLKGYYPTGTKFVILPMDMAFMGAGNVKENIDKQHDELAKLSKNPKYNDILIPFAHIDPRRSDSFKRLKSLVEDHNFRGVKIYPTLGYSPSDKLLMEEIYPYMVEKNIPLMAHCSPGSVYNKKIGKKRAYAFADPNNYCDVMDQYPELKICLGHFGGIYEWEKHIHGLRDSEKPTWLAKITELIKSGKYPNLYADISYTVFSFKENVPYLDILLEDQRVFERVLFGSDFYMVETEKYAERRLSTELRSALKEKKFWQIANTNPKTYLGLIDNHNSAV